MIPLPVWILRRALTRIYAGSIWLERVSWVSIIWGMKLHKDSNAERILVTWNKVSDMNHTTQDMKTETEKNFNTMRESHNLYSSEAWKISDYVTRDNSTRQMQLDLVKENMHKHTDDTPTKETLCKRFSSSTTLVYQKWLKWIINNDMWKQVEIQKVLYFFSQRGNEKIQGMLIRLLQHHRSYTFSINVNYAHDEKPIQRPLCRHLKHMLFQLQTII